MQLDPQLAREPVERLPLEHPKHHLPLARKAPPLTRPQRTHARILRLVTHRSTANHPQPPGLPAVQNNRPRIKENYTGPQNVLDQVLAKNLGKHWNVKADRDGTQYYQSIKDRMDHLHDPGQGPNWVPHFVSIRNRRTPGVQEAVLLSKVIELVRAAHPSIDNFYTYGCRGTESAKWVKRSGPQGNPT